MIVKTRKIKANGQTYTLFGGGGRWQCKVDGCTIRLDQLGKYKWQYVVTNKRGDEDSGYASKLASAFRYVLAIVELSNEYELIAQEIEERKSLSRRLGDGWGILKYS